MQVLAHLRMFAIQVTGDEVWTAGWKFRTTDNFRQRNYRIFLADAVNNCWSRFFPLLNVLYFLFEFGALRLTADGPTRSVTQSTQTGCD
jgi:hypothetical protein